MIVTFGDSSVATTTTLKAESGRLMDMRVEVPAGQVVEKTFTTNVRTPHLPKLPQNATGREEVSLDQFDPGSSRDWDDKLTVEVVSPHPRCARLRLSPRRQRQRSFLPATRPLPTAMAARY